MFYVVKATVQVEGSLISPELGRCRRHAPTMGGFPAVFPRDWCGDHKLDETRLEPPPPETPSVVDSGFYGNASDHARHVPSRMPHMRRRSTD